MLSDQNMLLIFVGLVVMYFLFSKNEKFAVMTGTAKVGGEPVKVGGGFGKGVGTQLYSCIKPNSVYLCDNSNYSFATGGGGVAGNGKMCCST